MLMRKLVYVVLLIILGGMHTPLPFFGRYSSACSKTGGSADR